MLNITVAGASGYIGMNLISQISNDYNIKALSRNKRASNQKNVHWTEVDLFSFSSTTEAFKDTDIAVYLVHSMLPSTRLFQGSFHDTDLMLADNFANACIDNNVKQIIYLSGIVPQGKVSLHLESRKEVEDVLLSTGIPCTILRAGLIVGNGGSSFEILKNLSINLPVMVLPKWTQSKTQVIELDDMIEIIKRVTNDPTYFNRVLNITNGENLKYKDLIKLTAKHVGKKTIFIPVPINYTSFSKLWVTIFGQSQYNLVSPLVDSLLCDFSEIQPDKLIIDFIQSKNFKDMLNKISVKKHIKRRIKKTENQKNNVRSIQRLTTQIKYKVEDVANSYLEWLPSYTNFIVKVEKNHDIIKFYLFGLFPLLILKYIPDLKMINRAKFHVVGGLLTKTKDTGWLEFRSVSSGKFVLASINEFVPSLPWYIYKYSQAMIHKFVMIEFGKYLSQPKKSGKTI